MQEPTSPWFWLLTIASVGGCSELWGSSTRPDPANCVRNPGICQSSQICNPITEACETQSVADLGDDRSLRPLPPASFVLPGGLLPTLDYPRDAVFTIAAQGSATIYYTLDGSAPIPGMGTTLSSASPLALGTVVAGTQLRWTADYGLSFALEPERKFLPVNSNPAPIDFGVIPEPARFDQGSGPVLLVTPGQRLTGEVRFQAWQSTPAGYCPGCIIQYVVAVDGVGAVGCMNTVTGSGYYPGQSASASFAFDAPMVPGRYRMYSGLTLQFSCDGSIADGPDVGEIIVK